MKIAFFSTQLCLRGTEVALYEYAKYNEEILGNKSLILAPYGRNMDALPKFQQRFQVDLIDIFEGYLKREKPDWLYIIKAGGNDGVCTNLVPCMVHAVFRCNDPHGDRYVYVSDWLARDQGYDPVTHGLPHIVTKLPDPSKNLRESLNIPSNATVFGCYGGSTEFNITFVHEVIKRVVNERKDIYFIFMNINKFWEDHPQIIHLPGSWDLITKSNFVNCCDAMVHARSGGETFGLAVAEFSICNKPVLTYELSGERNHIELLGERGLYYKGYEDFYDMVNNLKKYIKHDDYYTCYKNNSPEIIMERFRKLIS